MTLTAWSGYVWILTSRLTQAKADITQQERSSIQSQINATSTDTLQPPLGESALLQELVAQFLAHDGYVETARAFAEEVATETGALQNGHDEPLKKYEVEEDREAINRNSELAVPIAQRPFANKPLQESGRLSSMAILTRPSSTRKLITPMFSRTTRTSTSSSGAASFWR